MPPGRGRSPPVGRGALCSEVPDVPVVPVLAAAAGASGAAGAGVSAAAGAASGRGPGVAPGRGAGGPGRGPPPLPPPEDPAPGRGPGVAPEPAPGRGAPPVDPEESPEGPGRGPPPGRGPGAAPGRGRRLPPPLPPPDMESRSLRATGASTVEDADLTNSPRDSSCVSTCLLVTPSSLASSCTRALPATDLLILEVSGGPRPRVYACAFIGRASRLAHGGRPASSSARDGRRGGRATRWEWRRGPGRAVRAGPRCRAAPGRAAPWGTPTGAPRGAGSSSRGAPTHLDRASDAAGRDRRSRPRPPLVGVPTPRPADDIRDRCAPARDHHPDDHDPAPPHGWARGFGPPVTLPRHSRRTRPRHRGHRGRPADHRSEQRRGCPPIGASPAGPCPPRCPPAAAPRRTGCRSAIR